MYMFVYVAKLQEMTLPVPSLVQSARETLGRVLGLRSPASAADLGRVLRMPGRDPGARVNSWLDGVSSPSPAGVFALECVAAGMYPPGALDRANRTKTRLATAEARAQRKAERAAARIAERAAAAIESLQAPVVVETPAPRAPIVARTAPTPAIAAPVMPTDQQYMYKRHFARTAARDAILAALNEYIGAGTLSPYWRLDPNKALDGKTPEAAIEEAEYPMDDLVERLKAIMAADAEASARKKQSEGSFVGAV